MTSGKDAIADLKDTFDLFGFNSKNNYNKSLF